LKKRSRLKKYIEEIQRMSKIKNNKNRKNKHLMLEDRMIIGTNLSVVI
jgi:hypothetical protein